MVGVSRLNCVAPMLSAPGDGHGPIATWIASVSLCVLFLYAKIYKTSETSMPIPARHSQAHAAYTEIKRRILAGMFTPSDRLREVEVADMLAIGRTPVREALKRIQDEGLITHEPGRGLVVTTMDQQEVGELYSMREVLEGAAAAFAARHATDAEIANMQALLDEGDHGDPVAQNLRFHEAIYSAAYNRYLLRSLQSLTETTYLLGRSTLSSPERASRSHHEHQAIVQAIRARDVQGAQDAARHHIHQALLERLKMLRQG
ncbi:FCD domain protein [Bordetella holmesii CDC-H635-BH]|uniref:FCD domain protein n=2 Tax=Bordetella holmesii TaxID=35814 RepID=A0A158M9Y1_9BORD|nr:bacterial regulatory s, gntR family protein [Bordetella holmesii ATCC 51541]AMD48366.1 GntR family transcriptional regulator [Bordetella holmesii F627]KAK98215.1 FCD domain protein [Bordetella holmesii CDC-H635-BH]KAL00475.1 FCD domain protein [Bordetella holmesii CDC-H585-BH]